MSDRIYTTLECGCNESTDGFIPNGNCTQHGTVYDIPVSDVQILESIWGKFPQK